MTPRIGRVHLRVRDLERAEHFYTRVLGLRVLQRDLHLVLLSSGDGHHDLAMHAGRSDGTEPPMSFGLRSLGFEVPSKAALAGVYARLGGARSMLLDTGLSWAIHTSDPDGNQVEIYCETAPRQGPHRWGGRARALSAAELRASLERAAPA